MLKKLGLVVAVVCVSLCVTIPAASAATADASAKAKSAYKHKTQDKYIKKLRSQVKDIGKALSTLTGQGKSNTDTIGTIVAGVPNIVDALGKLRDGLTRIGDAYLATEYGALGVFQSIAGSTTTPALVATRVTSADIPDSGNPTLVSATFPTGIPAAGGPGVAFVMRAAIRGTENDGGATGAPAGEVGGLMFAVCASAGCGTPGTVICAPGQTPPNTYTLPDGTSTSQNLVAIQQKVGLTDLSAPTANKPEVGGNGTDVQANCTVPITGAAYTMVLHVVAQFADIPDSLTPGPKD